MKAFDFGKIPIQCGWLSQQSTEVLYIIYPKVADISGYYHFYFTTISGIVN